MLNDILPKAVEADQIVAAAKKAKRELTEQEKHLVLFVQEAVDKIIQVSYIVHLFSLLVTVLNTCSPSRSTPSQD
jgi:hypothetical protein